MNKKRVDNKVTRFLRFCGAYNHKETKMMMWHPFTILLIIIVLLMFLYIPVGAVLGDIPEYFKWIKDDIKRSYKEWWLILKKMGALKK